MIEEHAFFGLTFTSGISSFILFASLITFQAEKLYEDISVKHLTLLDPHLMEGPMKSLFYVCLSLSVFGMMIDNWIIKNLTESFFPGKFFFA